MYATLIMEGMNKDQELTFKPDPSVPNLAASKFLPWIWKWSRKNSYLSLHVSIIIAVGDVGGCKEAAVEVDEDGEEPLDGSAVPQYASQVDIQELSDDW
jgi:hypothetical protein